MARKTNKTAHVLNLITNPAPTDEDSSIEVSGNEDSSIKVNVDVLDAKDTSENIISDQSSMDKGPNLADPPYKTDPPKASSNHPQTPVVEILYNEHDPLSDIIKTVLEETSEAQSIANETTDSIVDDSSIVNANVFEYNLEFDDDGNEISSDSKTDTDISTDAIISDNTNINISETESNPTEENTVEKVTINEIEPAANDTPAIDSKEDLTIESAIESALETAIADEPSNSNNSNSLFEKLENARNNHLHDRTDLNSMIDLDFKYVNVYERIVQNKLLDYMKKFDMCMCDRCIVDTFALAVTELPTKIVVVDKNEVFPLINFFEVKNTAIISTALIKACMVVKEKPHHK